MGNGRIEQRGTRGQQAVAWSLPPAGPISEIAGETLIDPALAALHAQWRRVAEGRKEGRMTTTIPISLHSWRPGWEEGRRLIRYGVLYPSQMPQ